MYGCTLEQTEGLAFVIIAIFIQIDGVFLLILPNGVSDVDNIFVSCIKGIVHPTLKMACMTISSAEQKGKYSEETILAPTDFHCMDTKTSETFLKISFGLLRMAVFNNENGVIMKDFYVHLKNPFTFNKTMALVLITLLFLRLTFTTLG